MYIDSLWCMRYMVVLVCRKRSRALILLFEEHRARFGSDRIGVIGRVGGTGNSLTLSYRLFAYNCAIFFLFVYPLFHPCRKHV